MSKQAVAATRASLSVPTRSWLTRSDVRCALLATVGLRVGCSVVAAIAVPTQGQLARQATLLDGVVNVWNQRDTIIYGYIAQYGYTKYGTTCFPPLYPVAMRLVSVLTGGNVVAAGLLIATAASFFMFQALYQFAERYAPGRGLARWTVLVGATLPTAFVFVAAYTEALFLALALWSMLAMWDRQWGRLAVLGLAGALTRQQGLLAVPAAWHELVRVVRRLSVRVGSGEGKTESPRQFDWRPIIAALTPVLAYGAWLLFTRYVLRAPLPQDVASSPQIWNLRFTWPGSGIIADLLDLTHPDLYLASAVLDATASLAALAALIVALRRIPLGLTLYLAAMFLSAQSKVLPNGMTNSEGRYLLALLPLCVVPAGWLMRRPLLRAGWLVIGVTGMLVFLWAFVLNLWTP